MLPSYLSCRDGLHYKPYWIVNQYHIGGFMKKLCDRLKELRNGESQASFAKKIGLSQVSYGRYELGTREPDLDTLIQIGLKTGKSIDWLLGLDDAPKPPTSTKSSPPPPSPCTKCEEKDAVITRLSSTVENQSSTLNNLVKKLASAPISGIARSQKTG